MNTVVTSHLSKYILVNINWRKSIYYQVCLCIVKIKMFAKWLQFANNFEINMDKYFSKHNINQFVCY